MKKKTLKLLLVILFFLYDNKLLKSLGIKVAMKSNEGYLSCKFCFVLDK